MSDNTVTIIGNLTRDPEIRFSTQGIAVVSFGIAVNKRYFDQTEQEWKEKDPSFFNCTAWRDFGENIATSGKKGQRWIIVGELQQRSWETDEGEKRNAVEIQVSAAGPDMKWATCEVERVERKTGNQQAAAAPAAKGGTASQRQPDPVYGDEEPF
jgi:single-strand DNA-binding protein